MNAVYAYNPQEASAVVANRIYYLLELNHWSVKTLSDKSNIPYETLKKLLARKIENTSIHNIIKIASAFHCNIDDLVGSYGNLHEPPTSMSLNSATAGCIHTRFLWKYFNEIDHSLDHCSIYTANTCIPLIDPVSSNLTSALNDTSKLDILDITSYPKEIKQEVEYGILISSHCYHPTYYNKDILLVSRKRYPLPGENAILLHHGEIYIRSLTQTREHIILKSVNGIGADIIIRDFSEWTVWGYVVGVHRL